jgi:hypothetical protein
LKRARQTTSQKVSRRRRMYTPKTNKKRMMQCSN